MFKIEMFPAREGDCLVVSYGEPGAPRRILIDGGRKATYADFKQYLLKIPVEQRQFELLIITHVDRDHIEGILALLEDPEKIVTFKDIWFNGYHHLHDGDFETFSAVQGERLSVLLAKLVAQDISLWNGSFGKKFSKAAAIKADGSLLEVTLDGGMSLTLLSPSRDKLTSMINRWEKECKKAGMLTGQEASVPLPEGFEQFAAIDIDTLADEPFDVDKSHANGSSIAVIAKYQGRSALFAGDAHADLLQESLAIYSDSDEPVSLDVFKLPHHGSRKNISKDLLQAVDCQNYLLSTSGSYFKHPDPVAMSRIIKYGGAGKHIWFNYSSDFTEIWQVRSWMQDYDYKLHFPTSNTDGYQLIELAT